MFEFMEQLDIVSKWLNKLTYCHGCGRFSLASNGRLPRGWRTIYQSDPDGVPGLRVCGDACNDMVRKAMEEGPITEPLETRPPPMPSEFKAMVDQAVDDELNKEAEDIAMLQAAVDNAIKKLWSPEIGPLDKRVVMSIAARAIEEALGFPPAGFALTVNVGSSELPPRVKVEVVDCSRPPNIPDFGQDTPIPYAPMDTPIPYTPTKPFLTLIQGGKEKD